MGDGEGGEDAEPGSVTYRRPQLRPLTDAATRGIEIRAAGPDVLDSCLSRARRCRTLPRHLPLGRLRQASRLGRHLLPAASL